MGENSEISYLIYCDSVSPQFTSSNLIKRLFKQFCEIGPSVSPTAYAGGFTNIKSRAVYQRFFPRQSVLSVHAYIIPLSFYAELSGRTNSLWRKSFLAALNPVFSKLFYSPRLPTTGAHSSLEISRVNELPDDYSSFWDKVRNKYENIFERDADFIRWRYFIPKHIPYEFYVVRNHGRLVGFFVIKVEDRTAVVVDCIAVSGHRMFQKMIEGIFDLIEHRKDIWNIKILVYDPNIVIEAMLKEMQAYLCSTHSFISYNISKMKAQIYEKFTKSGAWYFTGSEIEMG